jgi:hypothetical protein
MAYLTIEIDQKVVAERELTDTVVVGRSLDCDLHAGICASSASPKVGGQSIWKAPTAARSTGK